MTATSMQIQLRVPSVLKDFAGGQSRHVLVVAPGATVADLLDVVSNTYPLLERRVRNERGFLRPHVNLFVGCDNVRGLLGVATVLHPGDEVSILPAISGG